MENMRIGVNIDFQGKVYSLGTLLLDNSKNERVNFKYSAEWLNALCYFPIQPDVDGGDMHYPETGQALIQCFLDTAPDRWGATLLSKKIEQSKFLNLCHSPELCCILLGNSNLQSGAIIFESEKAPVLIKQNLPHISHLSALYQMTLDSYNGKVHNELIEFGATLGGSRPKVNIIDKDDIYIAKFSKPNDEWNVPAWEYVNLEMAKLAGINTPETKLIKAGNTDVLLIKRFDRTCGGQNTNMLRVSYLSAKAMLNSSKRKDRKGYCDIVEAIEKYGKEEDAKELWSRMVLNIITSNVDDHLKNHGFLRGEKCWELSPVFDLESTPNLNPIQNTLRVKVFCMGVYNGSERDSTLIEALNASELFHLSTKETTERMEKLEYAVSQYKNIAKSIGISNKEIDMMSSCYTIRVSHIKERSQDTNQIV